MIQFVEQGASWHLYVMEEQSAIVNTIQRYFDAHVFDRDASLLIHIVQVVHWVALPNWNQESIDALVLTLDDCLRKDYGVIRMACTIGDPILL